MVVVVVLVVSGCVVNGVGGGSFSGGWLCC